MLEKTYTDGSNRLPSTSYRQDQAVLFGDRTHDVLVVPITSKSVNNPCVGNGWIMGGTEICLAPLSLSSFKDYTADRPKTAIEQAEGNSGEDKLL